MQTPVDEWEQMVGMAADDTFNVVKAVMNSLGDRPFMKEKATEEMELAAYQALRSTVDGMYNYAEGIRVELEARLGGYSAEERLALGWPDSEVRRVAYLLTLKYVQRMNRISEKLGIHVEGLEPVEPLPPVVDDLGGEEWLSPLTQAAPELAMGPTPLMSEALPLTTSALSPTEPLIPTLGTQLAPF